MKKKFTIIAFLLTIASGLYAQIPDSVKVYVDSALTVMETRSLNSGQVNWRSVREAVYRKCSGAKTFRETFSGISYAFMQLKDYHGMVANADTFARLPPPVDFDKIVSKGLKKEAAKGPRIVTAFLDERIAYLRIPTMNVTEQADMDKMANKLRDSLCKLMEAKPSGIIIDLRIDNGGNSAPMLSGIGPLFHQTLLGYGVDRNGKLLGPERMKNGIILDDKGNPMVSIKNSCSVNRKLPIALLIGTSTVSSGEITAAFLKQQSDVRTFGQPTPGFCSATEGFVFGNGQGYLLLTVNRVADAKKHTFKDLIVRPDVLVPDTDEQFDNLSADRAVRTAVKWLKSQRP